MISAVRNSTLGLALDDLAHGLVNRVRGMSRELTPRSRRELRRRRQRRADADDFLARFSLAGVPAELVDIDGAVLVDGMWDNATHWLRYAILRRALGLARHSEIGLTGKFARRQVTDTLRRFGIERVESFLPSRAQAARCRDEARAICRGFDSAEDVLAYEWPGKMPPSMIYDEILRQQKGDLVDVGHPRFEQHVGKALLGVTLANDLFERRKIGLIVLSHLFPFDHAALAWAALERGIPAIIAQGAFGTIRLVRMYRGDDYLDYSNAPAAADIDKLSEPQKQGLRAAGRAYMAKRLAGQGEDMGSAFAFIRPAARTSRDDMCRRYGWPLRRPIVAIYACKWFDTPHAYGMRNFRDFLDWMRVTLRVACERDDVSWLLKAHPVDDWYGGLTLRDVIPDRVADNVRLADDRWNGRDVIDAVDALITMHGTAGVEFSMKGKPVLCADRGWYSEFGFVQVARSREHYESLLRASWWDDVEGDGIEEKAALFTGLFYGVPRWQEGLIMPDDIVQDEACGMVQALLGDNAAAVEKEMSVIRDWYDSGRAAYHPFKMLQATEFSDIISNRRIDTSRFPVDP